MESDEKLDFAMINAVLDSDMHLVVAVKFAKNEDGEETATWLVDQSGFRDLPFLIAIAQKRFDSYINQDEE